MEYAFKKYLENCSENEQNLKSQIKQFLLDLEGLKNMSSQQKENEI